MKIEINASDLKDLQQENESLANEVNSLKYELRKYDEREINYKCNQLAKEYVNKYFKVMFEKMGIDKSLISVHQIWQYKFFEAEFAEQLKDLKIDIELHVRDKFKKVFMEFIVRP
jgi:hypothetical protein